MFDKTVLIIDDDILLCRALSRRLSIIGVNAVSASTGNEGLNKVRQQRFDIIFVDINLPDINGLELMDKIQELSLFSRLIIITSETNEEYRRTAISKGAVDYIEKPFGFSEIKKLVNSIFSCSSEKRGYKRFTCDIPCNISLLNKPDADAGDNPNDCLYGKVVDISKKGIELRFEKDIPDIAEGKLVRIFTGVRDQSFFDLLPPDIIAEIIWVKALDREIYVGLKYL